VFAVQLAVRVDIPNVTVWPSFVSGRTSRPTASEAGTQPDCQQVLCNRPGTLGGRWPKIVTWRDPTLSRTRWRAQFTSRVDVDRLAARFLTADNC
jgi:hypothetical protein